MFQIWNKLTSIFLCFKFEIYVQRNQPIKIKDLLYKKTCFDKKNIDKKKIDKKFQRNVAVFQQCAVEVLTSVLINLSSINLLYIPLVLRSSTARVPGSMWQKLNLLGLSLCLEIRSILRQCLIFIINFACFLFAKWINNK